MTNPPERSSLRSTSLYRIRAVLLSATVLVLMGLWVHGAAAQQADGEVEVVEVEVRVAAQRLPDGRTEFALQEREAAGSWAERRLPRARFFPANAQIDRWLSSSPLVIELPTDSAVAEEGQPPHEVRVAARLLADGRMEFALQEREVDGSWAERRLPRARFLPANPPLRRWLSSSPIIVTLTIDTPVPATESRLPRPPNALGLSPFYTKYVDAHGLPIVASDKVPDEALFRAKSIVEDMLAFRPDIRAELIALGRRVTVVSFREAITDIPEFRDIYEKYPGVDWSARVQGGGLTGEMEDQTTAIWEGNLLCNESDIFPREDIAVREFARTILNFGVEQQHGGKEFRRNLEEAYKRALDVRLWGQTAAGESPDAYWAEGVQSWFGLNDWAVPSSGVHNQINTRHELQAYDPSIADLIREVFGETTVSSTCHVVAASVDVGEQSTFEFLGDVPPAKQAEIRALDADIRNVFHPYASGKPLPASLVVSYDQAMLKDRFTEVAGYEFPGDICGVREESLFVSLDLCDQPTVFAHEYFHHFLQAATAPGHLLPDYGEGYSDHGPWWLTEGAAVYGENLYVVSSGIATHDEFRDDWIRRAKDSTRRLADLELAAEPGAYSLGFLAVEWLAQNSGEGALLEYYEMLLVHDTWQAAFEGAFGLTVDEFYDAFEEHRSEILPTIYRIAGVVLGPDGQPLAEVGIWAWEGKGENDGFRRTGPEGSFSIAVPEGSFELLIYAAVEPDCSFVGWYDGARGLATERSLAATVVVDDAGVEGIEIRLPDYPDRLPFIQWCS